MAILALLLPVQTELDGGGEVLCSWGRAGDTLVGQYGSESYLTPPTVGHHDVHYLLQPLCLLSVASGRIQHKRVVRSLHFFLVDRVTRQRRGEMGHWAEDAPRMEVEEAMDGGENPSRGKRV